MNPYEILGVSKTATIPQIKSAYRAKSKTEHPDVGGDADRFIELSNAYTVLMDPEMREHYDLTGEVKSAQVDEFMRNFMDAIAHMMKDIIRSDDFSIESFDLVGAMKQSFDGSISVIQKQILEQDTAIRKLTKIKKRIYRNDDGDNIIASVVDEEIATRAKERDKARANVALAKRAIEELEHYKSPTEFFSTVSMYAGGRRQRNTVGDMMNFVG